MYLHELDWVRPSRPALSSFLSGRAWNSVQMLSPTVVRHDGRYLMWFTGNGSETRRTDDALGLAESADGIHWTEHPASPVLRPEQVPFGAGCHTPRVLYDEEQRQFRLWFVAGSGRKTGPGSATDVKQTLGHAVSRDGISWTVDPEPLWRQCRGPCVLKCGRGDYRMWMNAAPDADGTFDQVVAAIYRFCSTDGLVWRRDDEPCVTPGDGLRSVVYPYVVRDGGDFTMWYGGHVAGGIFEIFCATSADGVAWTQHRGRSAFPATCRGVDFDGRYTSTPCVLVEDDRYLLYYSSRDLGCLYRAGDNSLKADPSGIYRHIAVATCARTRQAVTECR